MSGKAFSHYGPVARGDLPSVLAYVSKISKIPKHVLQLNLLGSAGKVPISGDIDIALDVNTHDVDKIRSAFFEDLHTEGYRAMPGGNFSIAAPNGDNDAQVDFILTKNLPWTLFSYFSAGDKSKYKGVHRALLLSAIAASKRHKVFDEDDNIIVDSGYVWVPTIGLEHQVKTPKFNKKGIRLKTFNVKKGHVIDDPQAAITYLFGASNIRPADIETFEQVFDMIYRVFDRKQVESIVAIFAERCKSSHIKVPEECKGILSSLPSVRPEMSENVIPVI